MAQLAPTCPEVPSAKTIRRRLQSTVKERQQNILKGLPDGAKLSIALDCWTSPFQQAFLAITGYFLDKDWEYREILLGFEPLHGTHSGANLSTVLFDLFQQHKITERVLAITTDNASNNQTLMSSIHESVQSLGVAENATIVRTPCIAHVIQLSLNQLLGKMKAIPKNETTDTVWSEARSHSVRVDAREQKREIVDTLNKVGYRSSFSFYLSLLNFTLSRFEILLSTLMQARNAEKHSAVSRLNCQSLCQFKTSERAGIQPF